MNMLAQPISIALETTCREGGVALGAGEELVSVLPFDAARRAATQVVARLEELTRQANLRPRDIEEIYVSCGPGSYTGTRVGVTAARTLAQAIGTARCVAVPTVQAVAENVPVSPEIEHLAVVLDARRELLYVACFQPAGGQWQQVGQAHTLTIPQLLESSPRPLHLVGEALGYYRIEVEGVQAVDQTLWLPRAEGVWAVGNRLSRLKKFTDWHDLQPIYTGQPEAVRLWNAPRAI
jgi:tRNA threonylcarbamoyladenosine biosynthesis protein TsaB